MNSDFKEIYEVYNSPRSVIGDIGEVLTASSLRSDCKLSVVRNIYLPNGFKLAEIDLIAISKLGIFVIENKNYKGKVICNLNDYYWTVQYSNSNFKRLYNPIKQNELHRTLVRKLLDSLGFEHVPIYNTVIFNDNCTLDLKHKSKNVFLLSDFIKLYNSCTTELISESEQSKLRNIFSIFSNPSDEALINHLALLELSQKL